MHLFYNSFSGQKPQAESAFEPHQSYQNYLKSPRAQPSGQQPVKRTSALKMNSLLRNYSDHSLFDNSNVNKPQFQRVVAAMPKGTA